MPQMKAIFRTVIYSYIIQKEMSWWRVVEVAMWLVQHVSLTQLCGNLYTVYSMHFDPGQARDPSQAHMPCHYGVNAMGAEPDWACADYLHQTVVPDKRGAC